MQQNTGIQWLSLMGRMLGGSVSGGLAGLAAGLMVATVAVAAPKTYVVDATINEGSCTVTLGGGVTSPLSLPAVERDTLDGGTPGSVQALPIVTTCAGLSDNKTPSLTLTGSVVPTSANVAAGTAKYLFNNNGAGAAKGYGILLSTAATAPTSWDTSTLLTDSDVVDLTTPAAGTLYAGETRTFYVGIGCGSAGECALRVPDRAAGTVNATLTFTFGYH